MRGPKTNIWTLYLAGAFALVVTVLDVLPWLESVPWYGFFVVPVIWVALWSVEDDILPLFTVALMVTILAMIRSVVSVRILAPAPIVDRLIIVTIIWLTVLLAVLRKRARRTYKWINLAAGQWQPDNPGSQTNQPNQTDQTNPTTK